MNFGLIVGLCLGIQQQLPKLFLYLFAGDIFINQNFAINLGREHFCSDILSLSNTATQFFWERIFYFKTSKRTLACMWSCIIILKRFLIGLITCRANYLIYQYFCYLYFFRTLGRYLVLHGKWFKIDLWYPYWGHVIQILVKKIVFTQNYSKILGFFRFRLNIIELKTFTLSQR